MSNQHIRNFLSELRSTITEETKELARKYDIHPDDVVFLLTTGVYINDGNQLMVGVTSTATNESELEGLLDGTDAVLDTLFEDEEPEQGTIEWWLNKFGPQDDQLLN
jgi:hypothetical protein